MDGTPAKKIYAPARPKGATHNPDTYEGEELQRPAGVGPARLRAFALPSRMGGKLYYPDGRVECIETN